MTHLPHSKLFYCCVILFRCEFEFTNYFEAAYMSVYWKAVNKEVVLSIKTEGALLWRESVPGSSPLLEVSFRKRCLFMG